MTTTSASVIYPELPDPLTTGDLQQLFNPSFEERKWAPNVARTPETRVALLVHLKIFQTIGRFMPAADIPLAAVEYVARKMPGDVGPTGIPDGIELGAALFSGKAIQVYRLDGLTQVLAKHRDIDVFGKSRDKSKGFRKRCAAFEEQPRAPSRQPVEQHVQCPADPEILFNVLHGSAKTRRCTPKQIAPVGVCSANNDLEISVQATSLSMLFGPGYWLPFWFCGAV